MIFEVTDKDATNRTNDFTFTELPMKWSPET